MTSPQRFSGQDASLATLESLNLGPSVDGVDPTVGDVSDLAAVGPRVAEKPRQAH